MSFHSWRSSRSIRWNVRAASFGAVALLLGATPLASDPELYGAGLFSTGQWDFFVAFTPDQRLVLFCRANDDFSAYDIYETRRDAGEPWRAPAKPAFARSWSNADPHISPDGHTLFFISNRPGPGDSVPSKTYDIWTASLESGGRWSEPRLVGPPVSLPGADEWSPSVAANGDLYFGSDRPGGRGGLDLYVARRVKGVYQAPENLGAAINSASGEVEPWIAPDESYLIFSAIGRSDSTGRYDLYLSRHSAGAWQPPVPLSGVNTRWNEFNQSVSPDGQWLYFSSTRPHSGPLGERFDVPRNEASVAGIGNGKGDIYRSPTRDLGLGH
jgi:Tol biopolymer transport system component